jgi:glutaredoxin 2
MHLNIKGIRESLADLKDALNLDLVNSEIKESEIIICRILRGLNMVEKNLNIYKEIKEGKK